MSVVASALQVDGRPQEALPSADLATSRGKGSPEVLEPPGGQKGQVEAGFGGPSHCLLTSQKPQASNLTVHPMNN